MFSMIGWRFDRSCMDLEALQLLLFCECMMYMNALVNALLPQALIEPVFCPYPCKCFLHLTT